jgi:enolase-phosphatase E1
LLGTQVHSAAISNEVARVSLPDEGQVRVLLLDIEGTTTPIDFVYKTLFPYASRELEPFLREHSREREIQSLIEGLRKQNELDEAQGLHPPVWRNDSEEARLRSSVAYAQWLMAQDSKCTPLKALQGKIWLEGYESGELRGEVYPDVPRAFERWRKQNREISIYSSGSVLAQQLLFRTVLSGDLTSHISAFFDTRIGIKTDGESYNKIAASLGRVPSEFLFISDAAREVAAAQSTGMPAIPCDRGALASTTPGASEIIHSFDEIFPN